MPSTTKKEKAIQRHIHNVLSDMKRDMLLHEYRLDFLWIKDPETHSELKTEDCAASIKINGTYLEATISINAKKFTEMWKHNDVAAIRSVLLHELCHILTEPMYLVMVNAATNTNQNFIEEIRERQTQRICAAILMRVPKEKWLK